MGWKNTEISVIKIQKYPCPSSRIIPSGHPR
jgi:hypothetical protein